jgi:hypothetical protein
VDRCPDPEKATQPPLDGDLKPEPTPTWLVVLKSVLVGYGLAALIIGQWAMLVLPVRAYAHGLHPLD